MRKMSLLPITNTLLLLLSLLMLQASQIVNGSALKFVAGHTNEPSCANIQCPAKLTCPTDSLLHTTGPTDIEDYVSDDAGFFVAQDLAASPLDLDDYDKQGFKAEHARIKRSAQEYVHSKCCPKQECHCQACNEQLRACAEGSVALELSAGSGKPGNCCATYSCRKLAELSCKHTAQGNTTDEQYYWRNECTRCSCVQGQELCMNHCATLAEELKHADCYSEQLHKLYAHGEKWTESEGCVECSCANGENECTANLCKALDCQETLKLPGQCCPICADSNQSKAAANGTIARASEDGKRDEHVELNLNNDYGVFIFALGWILLLLFLGFLIFLVKCYAASHKIYLVVPYSETNLSQATIDSTFTA